MKSRVFLAAAAAGFLLASCAKNGDGDGIGSLRLTLQVDPSVVELPTRGGLALDAPQADEFSLNIRKSDGSFDRSWDKLTDYEGDGYKLKIGTYHAAALYGSVAEEGFDKPAFGAEADFEIYDQITTKKTLAAKLVNMAAAIAYTEGFQGYFPHYHAVITTGAGSEIDFADNPGGTAFMDAKPFKVKVHYQRQNGNGGSSEFTVSEGVAPCKYFNITVDVNSGGVGAAAIVVTFDDTVETIPLDFDMGED